MAVKNSLSERCFFKAMFSGLQSIAEQSYLKADISDYFAIPENKKFHFDILLRNCRLERNGISFLQDIGLRLEQKVNNDYRTMTYTYLIDDLGDLSHCFAYEEFNCEHLTLTETKKIVLDEPADFIVHEGTKVLLTIENGLLN